MFLLNNKKGFTLVEMLVAVSIFVVISVFAIGAVLSIFDANRKARTNRTVVDNLNIAMEDMARTVRFGTTYHCGSSGNLTLPDNCTDNSESFLAINFKGETVIYGICPGVAVNGQTAYFMGKNSGGSANCNQMIPLTAPDVNIQELRFYVFGAESNADTQQPYVVALIKGYVAGKSDTQSDFFIQTTMSQRKLDI